MAHQTILVLDFGSQYTQLIARRLRELAVHAEILPFDTAPAVLEARRPVGLILSGGPQSVTEADAPRCDPRVFDLGIPVLGICYGMQMMAHALGGTVARATQREYGHAVVRVERCDGLFEGLPRELHVWASHGDFVAAPPAGFGVLATSESVPLAAMADPRRRLYGLLFHPEVAHTERGTEILRNFAYRICGCRGDWTMASFVEEATARLRSEVGAGRVVCALSGGVDSTVTAVLLHRAVGDQLMAVFVDNGLLRDGEVAEVQARLRDRLRVPLVVVDAAEVFLSRLRGVADPEAKRKIIGATFIEVFAAKARELGTFEFLAQGTLYPDVIESTSVVGPAAPIKSHHNVGGLPASLPFRLLEPLRELFKDEVRRLGEELGLGEEFVWRHPFPGPGLAVRIIGEVTPERLALVRQADRIVVEEVRRHGWYRRLWQAFAVLLPVRSVGVMGDARTYEYTVAVRAVESRDGMTADWARLPEALLAAIAARIVNEVKGVNRVVYDVSTKPPSTIEWE